MDAVDRGSSVTQNERNGACGPHYMLILCLTVGFVWNRGALAFLLLSLSCTVVTLWVWKRKGASPFVLDHVRESLNFQITYGLAVMGCFAWAYLSPGTENPASLQGPFGVALLTVIALTFFAGHRAASGLSYRYPVCLRLAR